MSDIAVVVAVSGYPIRELPTAMIDIFKDRVSIWEHQVFSDGTDE